ncbi:MAG: non-homologous end-joining DNA ligase [Gemmatimonadaceae bacterium]
MRGTTTQRGRRPVTRARVSAELLATPRSFEPMLASTGDELPKAAGWTFEPKYDGIRFLGLATPAGARLITRRGNDRSSHFPAVANALAAVAKRRRRSFVIDGEVVAMEGDRSLRFQALQGARKGGTKAGRDVVPTPTTLFAFDLLVDGPRVLVHQPWAARHARLENLLATNDSPALRLAPSLSGEGEEILARARAAGWEGVIAKRTDSVYEAGARSRSWLKLKLEHQQEFVVGGFTEPRNTRQHIGALLLGYYDGDSLVYAGHTGGGFTRAGLGAMAARLAPLERATSPFTVVPKTNSRAHWVRPKVVVEVRFNEWTDDGRLRQPIFLGVRTDKRPRDVVREPESVQTSGEERPRKEG